MLFIRVLIEMLLITAACQSLTVNQSNQNKEDNEKLKFLNSTNIYPVQYPYSYNNLWTATHPETYSKANEQPVIGVSLESEILNKSYGVSEMSKQPLSVKYNNNIYHFKTMKRASPLAKDKQKEYPKYIVRKQRNLNKNHDDKLIEQNNDIIKYVNNEDDRQNTTTNTASLTSSSSLKKQPSERSSHEIRYLHDIFLNYPKTQHVNFGHVELSPVLFEKRFESQKAGNRYKGEIMWLDNTGGFAQHYWDLALGKV